MAESATLRRTREMLLTAFGPAIRESLEDEAVTDILANPDGSLWLDRHGEGRSRLEDAMPAADAERVIRLVASWTVADVSRASPIVSAELPLGGERFEGLLPPVVTAPAFAIRKPAAKVFSLFDYVDGGIITPTAARALSDAVMARRNILVVGGTGSGKTTLVNALLNEIATTGDRVVILEDTRELKCAARDCISLRSRDGVTLADLVRATLRLRPDRIIVGEVRGAEALDMLKAWNTGHPGGIATAHANSARAGLYRLEQLVQETVVTVPRHLIAHAVHIVAYLEGRGEGRRLASLAMLDGLDGEGNYILSPIPT